jgi:endogenous inhibitor of DNA gyrase (YacG/DUF329 family)
MKKIPCPMCQKKTEYSPRNSSRPFCSERCKIQDAANWADDQYVLVEEEPFPSSLPGTSEDDDGGANT